MEPDLSPFPWTTDPECGDESVLDADGIMVADCAIFSLHKGFRGRGGSNVANARAIAALPALLTYAQQKAREGCSAARAVIAQVADARSEAA